MIKTIKVFQRQGYLLIVDTRSGKRVTTRTKQLPPELLPPMDVPLPQDGVVYDNSHPEYVIVTDSRGDMDKIYHITKIYHGDARPHELGSDSTGGPSLGRKVLNYGKAKASHVLRGSPTVTPEVIQERFAICLKCPTKKYRELPPGKKHRNLKDIDPVGVCDDMSCGCFLHGEMTEPNKLAWADQECPDGHWERTDG